MVPASRLRDDGLKTLALLLTLAPPLAALEAPRLESYAQTLQIRPAAGVALQGLSVAVAPLLGDAQWAFTQRWDDNLIDNLRVRDLMNRRRMQGSFYLNASDAWYGNESRYPFAGDPAKLLAKALLQGGHSIGGHGLTHSYVPAMNRLEMFYETLGVRIDREVNSQSPINSFVFPFTAFRNSLEGDRVHRDIAQVLINGGYIHVANQYFNKRLKEPTPLLDSWLLPCDGQDVNPVIRELLRSPRQQQRDPVLCLCMHAWPAQWGGPSLPKLDRILRTWPGRKDWWYANGNALSAYRWQVKHGGLRARAEGDALLVELDRFEPWELGDAGALTLKVSGAGPLTPTASLDGRELKISAGRSKGSWLVELPHSPGRQAPKAFDWHRNHANRAAGLEERGKGVIEGLQTRLWREDGFLRLRAVNRGPDLQDLRVSWRLPLGVAPAPPHRRERLKRGESLELDLALALDPDPLYHQGQWYAAAQIDYVREGQRQRLYSDVRVSSPPREPSFPKGAFWVLGPLPSKRQDFDLGQFNRAMQDRRRLQPCIGSFPGRQDCWAPVPESLAGPLHPELIPAGGTQAPRSFYTWDPALYYPHGQGLHYWLAADIESPRAQTLRAYYPRKQVLALRINGQRMGKGRTLALKPGRNRLMLLYGAGTPDADGQGSFNILNYGPFFRLVDAEGRRATDIRYLPPAELQAAAR
jgi:hypothetical protein